MLEIKDIEKLAILARIELNQKEKEKLLKEVGPILDYITQLKEAISDTSIKKEKKTGKLRNVMREDENPTETGINTKNIVANMPNSQDNYLKVKKIL